MDKPKAKHRPWNSIKPSGPPIANRSRDPFYHTARWTRESRAFRQQNPLCAHCRINGFIVPSEVTDHKVPKNVCKDPWDKNNWEAICKKCHAKKGPTDKKHFKT